MMNRIPIIFKTGIAISTLLIMATCSKLNVNQNPPDMPSAPTPADGGTLDSLSVELSWTCSDPDGDPLSYDIYIDTSSTPDSLVATVDTTSYTPVGLRYNSTYYWQIVATDTTGLETAGPVWSFSFSADMIVPSCSLIAPNGGELWYIDADYDITWEASDDDNIAFFVLEYSIDEINNWVMIGDTIDGNTRDTSWTIPSTPSPQCLVRISCYDFGGNTVSDTSDSIFMIWPQGGMIAFSSDRDGPPTSIFTMYANGDNPQNITNMSGLDDDVDVDWSPDCSRFVYRKHINSLNDNDIFVMNFDGSGQTNITNSPTTNDSYPAWSPLGDRIAFSSIRDGTDSDIWLMNPDGSNLSILTSAISAHDSYPSWSPTGDQIVFHSTRDGGSFYDVYTMNSDGSNPQRLTAVDSYHDAWPAWSPEGSLIAFCTNRHGENEIYTINSNGSNPQRLTNNTVSDFWPRWSPDGNRIVFMSYRTNDWEIWIMDADGGNPVNISNDLASDIYGSWSPIH